MPREQSDIFEYKEGVMETLRTRRKKFGGATAVAMLVGLSLRRHSQWYISRRWPHSSLLYHRHQKLLQCVVVLRQVRFPASTSGLK